MEQLPKNISTVESSLNTFRIKVTEQCPWQCSFCHSEGGRYTSDLKWGPEAKEVFKLLQKCLPNFKEIHYTGGEPTKNSELALITTALTGLGFEVKTTTNGQFSEESLKKLIEAGIKSFNFSVHSLGPHYFLKSQKGRGIWWQEKQNGEISELPSAVFSQKEIINLEWAENQIERELAMILKAKKLGVDVKMNTVISNKKGIENTEAIFQWAKKHQIPIRLLNDLSAGQESIDAIYEFIKKVGAKEVMRKITRGSSSCSIVYKTEDDYEFAFKQIRDFKLESMCRNCPRDKNQTCEEQFYGIRLQQGKNGKYYVILCIQESNKQTQMTLEEFIQSPQLKEIQRYLTDI